MLLDLDSGARWRLEADDRHASDLLQHLAPVLKAGTIGTGPAGQQSRRLFRVACEGESLRVTNESTGESNAFSSRNFAAARCWSGYAGEERVLKLIALSLVLAAEAQVDGGLLLHGAVAENHGVAALLLGPSGRGKSTTSRMLAPPWRSLSDDMALVLPGAAGRWQAHPWPTWSALQGGEPGGAWDVQQGVDLRGVFVLDRSHGSSAERVGAGRAACVLMESFEQAWWAGSALFPPEILRDIRRRAFDNCTDLTRDVPAFILPIGEGRRAGETIDEALGEVHCTG